jgi:hypothetical protein
MPLNEFFAKMRAKTLLPNAITSKSKYLTKIYFIFKGGLISQVSRLILDSITRVGTYMFAYVSLVARVFLIHKKLN